MAIELRRVYKTQFPSPKREWSEDWANQFIATLTQTLDNYALVINQLIAELEALEARVVVLEEA